MSPKYFHSLSNEEKNEFLDSFDTVVTDCDGVLWNDSGVLSGAPSVIDDFISKGKRVFYVTNNSTKTKKQFLAKCRKFGFAASEDSVCNTSSLAAAYLKETLSPTQTVYVVGAKSLEEELHNVGIENFGTGLEEHEHRDNILENITSLSVDFTRNVGAVLVGFDEHINYVKMLKATTYLRKNPSCLFVCTNTDETFPTKCSFTMPGTGAIVAGIEVASGRKPFVIGKPSTYLARYMTSKFDVNPKRTVFIGDRCNTDILMGNKCSFKTLLVLSGVHSIDDMRRYETSQQKDDQLSVPQYYTDNISDLRL